MIFTSKGTGCSGQEGTEPLTCAHSSSTDSLRMAHACFCHAPLLGAEVCSLTGSAGSQLCTHAAQEDIPCCWMGCKPKHKLLPDPDWAHAYPAPWSDMANEDDHCQSLSSA